MSPNPVSIKVTETGAAPSKTIQIQVSQDPINLQGHGHGAVPIHWEIDPTSTEGWLFAANGIAIGSPKFADGGPANGNRRHSWTRNANQADGNHYKYSISVTKTDASGVTTTVIVDPGIVNQS